MEKKVPIGVKVISILYFLFAILLIYLGFQLLKFQLSKVGMNVAGQDLFFNPLFSIFGTTIGMILIALAFLYFISGMGLWVGNKWSRKLAGVLALFILLMMIGGSILNTISGIIVGGSIIGYLFLNKKVQEFFG